LILLLLAHLFPKLTHPCPPLALPSISPRHTIYKTQYRTMFILNCTVKTNVNVGDIAEAASAPPIQPLPPAPAQQEEGSSSVSGKQQHQQQQKKEGVKWEDTPDGEAPMHAVECKTCGTVVGVQDEDEVTHFFNVIAS